MKMASSHGWAWCTLCSCCLISNLSPPRTVKAYVLMDGSKYFTTIVFSSCHIILFYSWKWHISSSEFQVVRCNGNVSWLKNISSCLLYFIFALPQDVTQFWRKMSTFMPSHWKPSLHVVEQMFFSLISLILSIIYLNESVCRGLT